MASRTRSSKPELAPIVDFVRDKPILPPSLEVLVDPEPSDLLETSTTSQFFDTDDTLTDFVHIQISESVQEIQVSATDSPGSITMSTLTIQEVTAMLSGVVANKNIPKFDKSDVDAWLYAFETATKKDNDGSKIDKLVISLTGDDLSWFKSQAEATGAPSTFAEWKAKFIDKYTDKPAVAIEKLRNRRQLESETPEKYCRDITNLCKKVNATMSTQEVLYFLRNGLLEKYKHSMVLMQPADAKEFQEKLETLVANCQTSEKPSETALLTEALLTIIKQNNAKPEATFVAADSSTNNQRHNGNGNRGNNNNRRNNGNQSGNQPKSCQYCKRNGHEADSCFEIIGYPPRNNGRNPSGNRRSGFNGSHQYNNNGYRGNSNNDYNNGGRWNYVGQRYNNTRFSRPSEGPSDTYMYKDYDGVPSMDFKGTNVRLPNHPPTSNNSTTPNDQGR